MYHQGNKQPQLCSSFDILEKVGTVGSPWALSSTELFCGWLCLNHWWLDAEERLSLLVLGDKFRGPSLSGKMPEVCPWHPIVGLVFINWHARGYWDIRGGLHLLS